MHKQLKRKRKEESNMDEILRFTLRNRRFKELHKHLKSLDGLIGMKDLKESIVSQIQFIITTGGQLDSHFLNTSLVGPPGTGKTTVAEILHKIWISLDIFNDDMPFTILHRSDFVGSYMGHTSNKTRKILNKYAGSVIFIDEAYSLMNGDKDEYGKEALDQLCAFMGEEKANTIVIIAGYEDQINSQFFDANPGLKRRFGWHFSIKPYSHEELFQIFQRQLELCGWSVDKKAEELFKINFKKIKNAGGDTENICFQSKLNYSRDNWMKKRQTKHLSYKHVQNAMEAYFKEEPVEQFNMYI
jgi:stage V sporulation protein K